MILTTRHRLASIFLSVTLAQGISLLTMPAPKALAENVVRWASKSDAISADPHTIAESPTIWAARKVYGALVYPNKHLKITPWLATSWTLRGRDTWEFKLREGVKWHDGSAFTADDVVFSLNRAKAPTSGFKRQLTSIKSIEKKGPHLVRVTTDGPNPILPNLLANIFIMSKAWASKHGVTEPQNRAAKKETYAVRHAMGTGPFILKSRQPGIKTVLVKNKNWWGLKQFPQEVDRVIYTPIANGTTRTAALLSGQIDFLLDPPLQDVPRLKATPGITVKQSPQIRTIFLGMNQARKELLDSDIKGRNPLADQRVRQALYQAIDIEAIKTKIMRGFSSPAGIITAPSVHGSTPELDKRRPYDVAAAKRLLREAGYPDGFRIRLDYPNNRYINDAAICEAIAGMLADIGVKVKLSPRPKAQHFPLIRKQASDFYMLGFGVPTYDSHFVFTYLVKSGNQGWNATGFKNAEVDRLIDDIETEVDIKKRDAMIAKVWQIVKDQDVYIPLHHQVIVWAMRDHIDLPIVPDNGERFIYAKLKKKK